MRGIPVIGALLLGLAAAALAGCGTKWDAIQDGSYCSDPVAFDGGVTYTAHVKPILDTACATCHATTRAGADRHGAPSGVNYDTYAEASANGESGLNLVRRQSMPPDAALASADCSVFGAWVDQGMPQ